MEISNTKALTGLRAGAIALLLGACLSGPVMAQDTQPALLAQTAEQPADEDEGGFDDWGLLGLLGLAGLVGLKKREPEVRVVNRDRSSIH
jgi:hypothetical protein